MQDSGQGGSGPFGTGGNGPFGAGGFGKGFGGPGRGKFFDDLAGMAGGAFSVINGAKAEIEAMVQAQAESFITRLNLVKREELDAALEVARRAREESEALALRMAALEARLDEMTKDAPPEPGVPPIEGTGPIIV
ncbi:accessory factor UbiK family protein [Pararoseomonas indoligenes]|uniref:Accessory factor UbiK family protein n=1 Tax=Roseomonas indoligenes TaxID=2820811 RepID=A0A940MUJ9_9PROT|nr:accessory factor UbiK family protein [Pararoseomonas indoligenes]MBP0493699.1 accessory factor UbiK family protein [Pararoseomonas indoligenes]